MTILITGATGFIGHALCNTLHQQAEHPVRGAVRVLPPAPHAIHYVQVGSIHAQTHWGEALQDVNQVVHLAARVHLMHDRSKDPLNEFRQVNVQGTVNLAQQAAHAGVKRFIFLSSVKVNGERTQPGKPFTSLSPPAPEDPYGLSKHEAEQQLRQIAAQTGMEVVIIRPPLVYGPGVKANFHSMMRWLMRGVPLPLAAVTHNRRSLISVDNLIDLIIACLTHPAAANQTLMASDGEDLSTADLLKRMGAALGQPARLIYVPTGVLRLGSALLNKPDVYQRLCSSLQIDLSTTRQLLNWTPPISVDEGLRRTAAGFALTTR